MENWAQDSEFLQTFRAEAEERLKAMGEGLIALEQSPGDEELIKRLFREAHTLKGSAGMMGLSSIKELAHRMEDIFSTVQQGNLKIERQVTDALLASLDRIEELLPSGEQGSNQDADVSDLLDRLAALSRGQRDKESPEVPESLKEESLQASVPAGPSQLKREKIHAVPDEKPAKSGAGVEARQEGGSGPAEKGRSDSTIRVHIERLDKLLNLMGEIIVNQIDAEDRVRELGGLKEKSRDVSVTFASLVNEVEQLKSRFPHEDQEQLSVLSRKLINAEQSVEALADGLESTTSHLKENSTTRRLALDELQDRTLHVRMLPLSTIFNMYPRVVRDACGASGKKVRLEISGETTELDKRILEQLADPLMHIIRNCVDHGIERPEERAESGKPEDGTIRLTARQKGNRVEIEVEDDGAGIDVEKVRQTAIARGMISPDAELSLNDIMDLIFRPGLSTASAVSDVSGRGVGLDVVKNNIEKLEGSVLLDSSPGAGARFTISLPVTLAVITGLLVESNGDRFVLPLGYIQEMVSIEDEEIQSLASHRGFLARGSAIPLIDLHSFLGGKETEREGEKSNVVIVGNDRYRLGLEVGRLLGEQEVVIKSPGEFFYRLPFLAGITILGNGEAVVVLNMNEIVRKVKEGSGVHKGVHAKAPEAGSHVRRRVLIVEDSLVVRELQKNILEAAGYEVETAVDGEDALSHLSREKADCVVTDIEMPRMNGFDLTAAIRHSEEMKEIPVIMVTSCSSEEDRRRGIEVGADAYVIKGTFDQQNLLSTIESLVA